MFITLLKLVDILTKEAKIAERFPRITTTKYAENASQIGTFYHLSLLLSHFDL